MSRTLDRASAERERWLTDTSDAAAWDARAVANELRKSGRLREAVQFAEEALEHWPDFEPIRGELAWALYTRDIKPLEPDSATADQRDVAKKAVERIQELVRHDPYSKYSAWPESVLALAKVAEERWPDAALDLLRRLAPERLPSEQSGDYPSSCARWHLAVTKALTSTKRWQELLDRCERALEAPGFRPKDRKWIRRRLALALEGLGRCGEAATILGELRREMDDWWLEADFARVLASTNNRSDAIDACRRALDQEGPLPPRWRTAALLADLLATDDPDSARDHYRLARHLRLSEGWPPDRELEEAAARAGVTGEPEARFNIGKLRATWRTAADPARMAGVVKTVLGEGGSGFITMDDGRDVYFAMPRGTSESAPPVGTRVTFRLVDSFDKKKNQPSTKAVDVMRE